MEQQALTLTKLDSSHRCDGCGAQAYVEAVITATAQGLLFCGHHWTKAEATFPGVIIADHREKLLARAEADEVM